jgi:hypothetical protein
VTRPMARGTKLWHQGGMRSTNMWWVCAAVLVLGSGCDALKAASKGASKSDDTKSAKSDDDSKSSKSSVDSPTEKASAPTANVAGTYTIASASNPTGGSGYAGSVKIDKNGDAFDLTWTITGGQGYGGVGLVRGDTFGVGWGTGKNYGVVVYKIDGGTLTGEWASSISGGKLGKEVLQGSPDLKGDYTIVQGTSPDTGSNYSGTVTIKPSGNVYSFTWKGAGPQPYHGAGLREGSLMIVGWGIGGGAGVVDYAIDGDKLTGKWAQPNGSALGAESLKRQ